MNGYLRLVDQPMQIRFEFRPARLSRPGVQEESGGDNGSLYVILSFEKTAYGPYASGITTTRSAWVARRTARPTAQIKKLISDITAVQHGLETAHAHLSREQSETGYPVVIDGPAVKECWSKLKAGPLSRITLVQVYEQFYEQKRQMVEADRRIRQPEQIAPSTLKTYPKRWVLIRQFLHGKKQPNLPVVNVTYPLATELKEWMQRQAQGRASGQMKKYDQATVHKVIGLLKMLLTYAQSKGYVGASPLATFTCPGGSAADPKPLSADHMDALESCDLPPVLRYQCDSWLVAAELCLHHADYLELPEMKIIKGKSGLIFVQHERAKQAGTSLLQTVNLTPRAHRIINKYGGLQHLYYGSAAYFSKVLKRIAVLADIRDADGQVIRLQFGQGRDTGLTARAVQGANSVQLSQMAGWRKPEQASRYIGNAVGIVEGFAAGLPGEEETAPPEAGR